MLHEWFSWQNFPKVYCYSIQQCNNVKMAITVSEKTFTSSVIRKNIPDKNRRWIYNPHLSFRAVLSNIIHLTFYHKYLRVYYLLLFFQFSFSFSIFKSCLFEILLVALLFKYWCSLLPNIAVPGLWIHPTWPATSCPSDGLSLGLCFRGWIQGTADHILFGNTGAVVNGRGVYGTLPDSFPRFSEKL